MNNYLPYVSNWHCSQFICPRKFNISIHFFFIPHCLIYTANLWECHSLATGSSLLSKMHRFLRALYQNSISLNAMFMFQSPPPPPPPPSPMKKLHVMQNFMNRFLCKSPWKDIVHFYITSINSLTFCEGTAKQNYFYNDSFLRLCIQISL